ncbi:membrane protein implicated in regulation of membrane protease activity [Salinibacter ruber]|jgi:membrane protein implicated in regulation of membrane protease activity|uniref:Nodulation efficiency protein D (NfeD) n=3 Tax=Salinibacter ruber TaxID=146919 RepID=Q2S0E6_SALRD|nr:NfeD family protein [Salinibacter ruber]ABC45242.1 Nodulation efficiency protein D (NfeD) [Salinibacter ruber DSM 13855]MBB4061167.1 membrane protein implicated in regulation of membrane protease activity [Salinibacter ruber]MBB4088467.1 membrane protein implicated in regulation of membrane protease activity [Salinibacter ruber]MCS3645003.1 membrane protein implicated in regulation of membrane protease activity [Salinibacter ruber]MCS3657613.1 membrane protein implicated in regulation of me
MDLDPTLLTWAFVVGGALLMLIEAVVPGGIAFFLGIGGVVVGGLRALGLLVDPLSSVVTWVFLSTGLTIALRPLMLRFVQGDVSLAMTDEDAEAMGETVTVVEAVGPESPGRIRFRGATWDARTLEGRLPDGAEAQLLYRDNLTWVVEPADHADLDAELSAAIGSDVSEGDANRSPSTDDTTSDDSGLGYDPSARSSS